MDRLEGKKEGSSHAALNKERVRQGYKAEGASKSKAIHAKMGEKKEMSQHEIMLKNNKTAMSIDAHNRSWNGKRYTK